VKRKETGRKVVHKYREDYSNSKSSPPQKKGSLQKEPGGGKKKKWEIKPRRGNGLFFFLDSLVGKVGQRLVGGEQERGCLVKRSVGKWLLGEESRGEKLLAVRGGKKKRKGRGRSKTILRMPGGIQVEAPYLFCEGSGFEK